MPVVGHKRCQQNLIEQLRLRIITRTDPCLWRLAATGCVHALSRPYNHMLQISRLPRRNESTLFIALQPTLPLTRLPMRYAKTKTITVLPNSNGTYEDIFYCLVIKVVP